jgi:uncharacterized protein YqjF (DUF2071 family)
MAMCWRDLLFAHWPVPAEALRGLIPPRLTLETFGGSAWLGVVPFRMTGVRPRMLPDTPGVSAFAELNVRTYVTDGQHPGVWFFSLDAASPLAVRAARASFHLPYFDAQMRCEPDGADGAGLRYASDRTHRGAPPAALRARYRPTGPAYQSQPGSLDEWLTERYCLYAADRRGRVRRGDIWHARWPLQPAEAELDLQEMTYQIGLRPPAGPPLLHFARALDVVAWLPVAVGA